jgi:hypothetical protein
MVSIRTARNASRVPSGLTSSSKIDTAIVLVDL